MAKILLVEDDDLVRDMLTQVLQRANHQVIGAANGEEATECLKNNSPDIMVTDIIMPKKSGITLISEVKNRHPNLEIIAISWQWDDVHFAFIHPHKENLFLGNNSSCVLRIDNGEHSILLTGDIEKAAEKNMLNSKVNLKATIMVAPHHGSKTSGLKQFIYTVHPQYILYAIGYRNRYHFPHPSVIEAYKQIHAHQFNTAETGAIQFKLEKK